MQSSTSVKHAACKLPACLVKTVSHRHQLYVRAQSFSAGGIRARPGSQVRVLTRPSTPCGSSLPQHLFLPDRAWLMPANITHPMQAPSRVLVSAFEAMLERYWGE
jgi:hypothetical protein